MVVGNPVLLQNDPHWRALLQYCWRNGAVVGKLPVSLCTAEPLPNNTPFIRDLVFA